jgi:hypothetical protein
LNKVQALLQGEYRKEPVECLLAVRVPLNSLECFGFSLSELGNDKVLRADQGAVEVQRPFADLGLGVCGPVELCVCRGSVA